jgi:predicted amidohydrolase YtcJ
MKYIFGCVGFLLCAQVDAATLVANAKGYSLDSAGRLQKFEALLVSDEGKVIATGKTASLKKRLKDVTIIDAKGATLLPGLIDAHGHVMGLGQTAITLDLSGTTSLEDALAKIRDAAAADPAAAWIVGRGWNQVNWGLGRFPTAAELDQAIADRPAYFERVDGHAGWANSKAMALAKITAKTADPKGGRIEKDDTGKPTGIFIDAASELVTSRIPAATDAQRVQALSASLKQLASVGLTSVHDAGISADDWTLYTGFAEQGRLSSRIYAMIGGLGPDFEKLSKMGPIMSRNDDLLAMRSVKLYIDGALGSRGAALLAPYSDAPEQKGLLFADDAKIRNQLSLAMYKGYQVNVHAIGDAGNRAVLDAFAEVLPHYRFKNIRHRIEHAQVVDPADMPRFRELGIIASVQPTHATSDKNMAQDRLGAERMGGAYAWRELIKSGARLAAGSDFPVEPSNPFYGWHAAVTRQDRKDEPAGGWRPWDALTRLEAFRLFTLDAAYAAHQETVIGTLEAGKWGDFILVDQDPFTVPATDIWKTKVLQTWLAGKQVYAAEAKISLEPLQN